MTTSTGSTLTGTCPETFNGKSTNGSFNFSVSGTTTGPFPGTFTESGSFTTSLSGHVNGFSSTFTIKNTAGTVTATGTKNFVAESDSVVECAPGPGGTQVDGIRRHHLSRHYPWRRAGYGHRDSQHR